MYVINTKRDKPDIGEMLYTVTKMMQRGVKTAELDELENYYLKLKEGTAVTIEEKYGIQNPNSPKQIVAFISDLSRKRTAVSPGETNDIFEICCIEDYKTGEYKWTSNSQALEKLEALGYEFASDILEYRTYKKLAESITSIKKFSDNYGLIHPMVTITKTNRISYKDPALMNIPKALLWRVITPLNENDCLYSVDIKNQEPNILLNMLQETELLPALTSEQGLYEYLFAKVYAPEVTMNLLVDTLPEDRIYTIVELQQGGVVSPAYYMPVKPASSSVYYNDKRIVEIETICQGYTPNTGNGVKDGVIYPDTARVALEDGTVANIPVEWDKNTKLKKTTDSAVIGKLQGCEVRISKAERKEFKTSWLALTYGAAAITIKESCKLIDGAKLYKYFTHLPKMKEYRAMIDKAARAGITQINNVFGAPMVTDKTTTKELKRSLLDLPIQGTGSGILALLIKHFNSEMESRGISDKVFIYYTRHDELIIEASNEYIKSIGKEAFEAMLKDIMEHQVIHETNAGELVPWIPFKVEISCIEHTDNKADMLDIFED